MDGSHSPTHPSLSRSPKLFFSFSTLSSSLSLSLSHLIRDDNSPPSAEIAYPRSDGYPTAHNEATEGTGKYTDPITMATDKSEIPIGSIVYMCHLKKYVVMEDDCGECDSDWKNGKGYRLDIWQGPQHSISSSQLYACEDYITSKNVRFIVNPPSNYPVDTTPLINPSSGQCTAKLYDSNCNYLS
jgi:hypothetical protein